MAEFPLRNTTSVFEKFATNDVDDTTTVNITYIGMEDPKEGYWYIQKIDETSSLSLGHATKKNNPDYKTYDTAWAVHTSLTYGNVSDAL